MDTVYVTALGAGKYRDGTLQGKWQFFTGSKLILGGHPALRSLHKADSL